MKLYANKENGNIYVICYVYDNNQSDNPEFPAMIFHHDIHSVKDWICSESEFKRRTIEIDYCDDAYDEAMKLYDEAISGVW